MIDGYIKMKDGIIQEVSAGSPDVEDTEEMIDYGEQVVLPGFIDLHTHGFATGSFTHEQTAESVTEMSKSLAAVGGLPLFTDNRCGCDFHYSKYAS